jgi:hypothetical protein
MTGRLFAGARLVLALRKWKSSAARTTLASWNDTSVVCLGANVTSPLPPDT